MMVESLEIVMNNDGNKFIKLLGVKVNINLHVNSFGFAGIPSPEPRCLFIKMSYGDVVK